MFFENVKYEERLPGDFNKKLNTYREEGCDEKRVKHIMMQPDLESLAEFNDECAIIITWIRNRKPSYVLCERSKRAYSHAESFADKHHGNAPKNLRGKYNYDKPKMKKYFALPPCLRKKEKTNPDKDYGKMEPK